MVQSPVDWTIWHGSVPIYNEVAIASSVRPRILVSLVWIKPRAAASDITSVVRFIRWVNQGHLAPVGRTISMVVQGRAAILEPRFCTSVVVWKFGLHHVRRTPTLNARTPKNLRHLLRWFSQLKLVRRWTHPSIITCSKFIPGLSIIIK